MSTGWSGQPSSDPAADARSLPRNPPATWPSRPVVHPETARALSEYEESASMSDEQELIDAAMLPSHERLVKIHRRLDPPGTSLLSVEQLVENLLSRADELQSDLERLEGALGRALGALRRCWNGDAWRRVHGYMVERGAEGPANWLDVLSWVADEPKKEGENVSDEVEQVMEVASPAERAAAGVDPALARWRAFSDSELQALREMSSQRSTSQSLNQVRRDINVGVQKEQSRREGERSSYRGPGRYRTYSGRIFEVLGTIGAPGVMKERTQIVMRVEGQPNRNILTTETMTEFNHVDDHGRRRFEYLGPLEGP